MDDILFIIGFLISATLMGYIIAQPSIIDTEIIEHIITPCLNDGYRRTECVIKLKHELGM